MGTLLRWIRRLFLTVLGVVLLLVVLTAVFGKIFSGPRWAGPLHDNFDGSRFRNMRPGADGGFQRFVKWQLDRQVGAWSRRETAAPSGTPTPAPPPRRVGPGELRITFVNHATMLIQQDELNLLTDPIWSKRASPVSFVGPSRYHPPGIAFDDLPPIDAVIISHNHYDHMDLPTLRRLQEKHQPRFFVGLGNKELFVDAGIGPVAELDWWSTVPLNTAVDLIGVPAQHFSNRGLFDRDATLWLGYVVKGPAGSTYFAGDTGAGPHFAEIKKRLGRPRAAILPIGAYRPEWFMERVHVSPLQAIEAHEALGAGTSIAMHFGTFSLGDDGMEEPVKALQAALAGKPVAAHVWHLVPGEGRDVPKLP